MVALAAWSAHDIDAVGRTHSLALEARATITPDDKGPILNLVAWNLMACVVLVTILKLNLSWSSFGFRPDDAVLSLAAILSLANSAIVSVQVRFGAGQQLSALSASTVESYEKASFASDFAFILTVTIAKAAVLTYLYQITPVRTQRRVILGVAAALSLWTVASLFAVAFQCSVPDTWRILSSSCFNQLAYWIAFGVINIVFEAILMSLPVYILWSVRIARFQKMVVIACFGTRLTIVAAVIIKLVYLENSLSGRHVDSTGEWPVILLNTIVQSLSVVTVSIPSIKTLLTGLQSGAISHSIQSGRHGSVSTAPKHSPLHSGNSRPPRAIHNPGDGNSSIHLAPPENGL